MKNAKLIVEANILDKIANSTMSDSEKLNFLRYVGYMTSSEKAQLSLLI
ncbi:MAG: hypothetical protein PHH06_05665 [Candidatus Gracilibacteria bacterium]|nr:hypothetical protein [Candidatus Gracilibacteria bacterium]